MTAVDLRRARLADAPRIREVHLAAIEAVEPGPYSPEQLAAWAHDRDPSEYPIEAEDTHAVVAESAGDVVGFGWMKPEADPYFEADVDAEITAVYVHPELAGRGIGSRLLERLEAIARQAGASSVGVWASKNAVPFYEGHGYRHVTSHSVTLEDDIELPVDELRKRLEGSN